MTFLEKFFILNQNYLTSFILFGTSIIFYYYQINWNNIKNYIKNKIIVNYKITNTNDCIDYNLVEELKQDENSNNGIYITFLNDKKNIISENDDKIELNYFYFLNKN